MFWVAALAGLFAMHGLSDHGAGGQEAMSQMSRAPDQAIAGSTAVTERYNAPGSLAKNVTMPWAPLKDGGHASLCLAILGGLVSLLVALMARRHRSVGVLVPRRVPSLHSGRERDPPCRLRLSVIRC